MAENIADLRFEEMRQTSVWMLEEVRVFKQLIQNLEVFEGAQLTEYCIEYLEIKQGGRKSKNLPLRAYYARKQFEYFWFCAHPENPLPEKTTAANELFFRKIPFVFEVVITIQYLHNQILDEKLDTKVGNHPKINQRLIASNILRETLFCYIDKQVAPLIEHPAQIGILKTELSKLLLWVDVGQHIDKTFNHYDQWVKGLPKFQLNPLYWDALVQETVGPYVSRVQQDIPSQIDFVSGYFQRIYLSNVYFFRSMTESIAALMGYAGAAYQPMQRFSILYGFMLQIINDYADFAYSDDKNEQEELKTAGKKTTDIFSDLYNFNVTFPLIYHLKDGRRGKIESYLEGGRRQKKILAQFPRQIKQEIILSGGIDAAIGMSRNLSKSASECLNAFNPVTPYFDHMCEIAMKNKFYKQFK
jgi:hypothetical protein